MELANLLALLGALLAAVGLAVGIGAAPRDDRAAGAESAETVVIERIDGQPVLRDTGGHPVPLADYRRIASLSIISDDILCAICEPQRLVCASAWAQGPWTVQLGDLPRLAGLESIEAVLDLEPDLVLVAGSKSSSEGIARLREHGIAVFALGSALGLASFQRDAVLIGHLIGHPAQGERLAQTLARRLRHVAAGLPENAQRPRAIYLASYGGQLYGGTRGADPGSRSSYHDVLTAAGCIDIAAGRFGNAWPQLSAEDVLQLRPELIVSKRGMADRLRRLPGIAELPTAQREDGIIELPGWMLEHPGRPMLVAAEALHDRISWKKR